MKRKIYLTSDTWQRLTELTQRHTGKESVDIDDRKAYVKETFNGNFKTTPEWGSVIFTEFDDYNRFLINL